MAIVTQPRSKALGTAFLTPGARLFSAGRWGNTVSLCERADQGGERGRRDREGLRSG